MKLTASHYDETVSIEVERDDLTVAEAYELALRLLIALGYNADQVRGMDRDEDTFSLATPEA